jgi:hypothetical protein
LFYLSSILPVVSSIYVEKFTDTLENILYSDLMDLTPISIYERQIKQDFFDIKPVPLPTSNRWNRTFGGKYYQEGKSVQQTMDGGYIIIGITSVDTGNNDIWLIKTDNKGNMLWNRTFGGTGPDYGHYVQQTSEGGFVIIGDKYVGDAGYYDVWLIKTDENGIKMWDKIFGGYSFDHGYSVKQTIDGGYIIIGSSNSFATRDFWLIKTDSYGEEEWNKTYGGFYDDQGYDVQQTTDKGYIITGQMDAFGINSGNVSLIKTDSRGNLLWNKTFGGTSADEGRSVQQTSDGGYIITGLTGWLYGSGTGDLWLIKTDSNGNKLWDKTFGGIKPDYGFSIEQTIDKGYIITGNTESYGAGNADVWLIKTDTYGNEKWNKTFGGKKEDKGYSVQQTSDKGYVITGYTGSFGNDSWDWDVWLIKTDNQGKIKTKSSGNLRFEKFIQHFPFFEKILNQIV